MENRLLKLHGDTAWSRADLQSSVLTQIMRSFPKQNQTESGKWKCEEWNWPGPGLESDSAAWRRHHRSRYLTGSWPHTWTHSWEGSNEESGLTTRTRSRAKGDILTGRWVVWCRRWKGAAAGRRWHDVWLETSGPDLCLRAAYCPSSPPPPIYLFTTTTRTCQQTRPEPWLLRHLRPVPTIIFCDLFIRVILLGTGQHPAETHSTVTDAPAITAAWCRMHAGILLPAPTQTSLMECKLSGPKNGLWLTPAPKNKHAWVHCAHLSSVPRSKDSAMKCSPIGSGAL